jgi:hypothetical protein
MRRTLTTSLLLVFAAVLAGLITSTLRNAPPRSVTLPDGVRLEFLGTTVGSANFTTELRWHRWLRSVLPRKWSGWIPSATSANCSSDTNSVTVYLRLTDSNSQAVGATPWQGYAAEDDTGFRYPREGGGCSTGGGSGDQLHGVILRTYPRRQSSFWLRFYDQTNGVMASLRVPNPMRGSFPEWQPTPLPQKLTNGPVILTLESLRETGREPWVYVQPKWNLSTTDPAWREARVRYFTFEDATGNDGSSLSRREPAWKGRARVYRERFEDFAPSERLVLTNLTIPAAGEFVDVDESAELAGVSVSVLVLAGAGEFMITNGVSRAMMPFTKRGSGHSTMSFGNTAVESWQGEKPFLLIEVQKALPEDEVFIRMFDEQGRAVKLERDGGWSGDRSGVRVYRRDFDGLENVQSVNLEVVLSRPLGFEFIVNPADVQPAKPD